MKILWAVSLFVTTVTVHAQRTYTIRLGNVYIDPTTRFKVNRVVDGRKNKVDIGRVQPNGWASRPEIAVLDQPLEQGMQDLLIRCYLISAGSDGYLMRVTRLWVSEIKAKNKGMKTILAEVAFDVFQMKDLDSCYYVGSALGRAETDGITTSQKHSENIGHALEDAIGHLTIKQSDSHNYFAIADLGQADFSFRDPNGTAVLMEDHHPDGVFLTYDEFLNNKPSITAGYEVEMGKTVKLYRVDEAGKKEQVTDGVYALCKDNELYVLFTKSFFVLQKRSGSFHFIGPALFDPAGGRNWIMFGATGVAVEAVTRSVKIHYRIDLDSGGFVEMSVVR